MKKQRKHYSPEEKVAILRRHLLDEPISKLCDELGLQPTIFYGWQKEFFENGAAGSRRSTRNAIRSWRWRGSNGTFVASKPLDDWTPDPSQLMYTRMQSMNLKRAVNLS